MYWDAIKLNGCFVINFSSIKVHVGILVNNTNRETWKFIVTVH